MGTVYATVRTRSAEPRTYAIHSLDVVEGALQLHRQAAQPVRFSLKSLERITFDDTKPVPVPKVKTSHHPRKYTMAAAPALRAEDIRQLAALPPPRRVRAWAKMAGLPVRDRAQVPKSVRQLFDRFAPSELLEDPDPQTERDQFRLWARQTGQFTGTRGRIPKSLWDEWCRLGKPAAALRAPKGASHTPTWDEQPFRSSLRRETLVVVDNAGIRHQLHSPDGSTPTLTVCGLRPTSSWGCLPNMTWALAGVRRCTTCRSFRRR